MKRERATELLEEVLERVSRGGERHLELIEEIHVFGSYARGALSPGDVDLAVEYGRDEASAHEFSRALAEGRDWNAPYRKALAGRRRGFQWAFHQTTRMREEGFDLVLLWRKGDSLATALGRLHAIELDQTAGRAQRDAMLPVFEGIDRYLPLPARRGLVELVDAGAIQLERMVLADGVVEHPRVQRMLDVRMPRDGIARRVREVGLCWFERQGIDPLTVGVGAHAFYGQATEHQLAWTLPQLNHLPDWLNECADHGIWLSIVNPTRRAPLIALKVTPGDTTNLPSRGHLFS